MAKPILELLDEVNGLKVNFTKSLILGVNMKHRALERATFVNQIRAFTLSYLSLPLSPRALYCNK